MGVVRSKLGRPASVVAEDGRCPAKPHLSTLSRWEAPPQLTLPSEPPISGHHLKVTDKDGMISPEIGLEGDL